MSMGVDMEMDTDMGMGTNNTTPSMAMMSPFLSTRVRNFYVLLEPALVNSTPAFLGAMGFSFAFSMLSTWASEASPPSPHELLRLRHARSRRGSDGNVNRRRVLCTAALAGGAAHAARLSLHYVNMLLVMTMNVWIIMAVVAGHAVAWMLIALNFGLDLFVEDDDVIVGPKEEDGSVSADC